MFDSDYANSDYLFARDKVERLSKSLEDFWRLEDKGLRCMPQPDENFAFCA